MDEDQIKLQIKNVVQTKYNGTYNHFKPALAIRTIGKEAYDYVCNKMPMDLHKSHSLMFHCFMNDILENPKCRCGNTVKFNTTTRKFQKYCSDTCRFEYFDESVAVRKNTNLKKHGTTNYLASKEGKRKTIETNFKKYGVKSYTQTEEYRQSILGKKDSPETKNNKRLGILKRNYNDLFRKYSHCVPLFKFEEYRGVKGYNKYNWKCNVCGKNFESSCDNGAFPICYHCKPTGSFHEILCKEYLDMFKIDYKFKYRGLPSGQEIDILIPEKQLGIEIGGLYYHSSAKNNYPKSYHVGKTNECESNNIKLFTIFDDEFYNPIKKRIVFNKLKCSIGKIHRKIPARKCEVVELSATQCNKFLKKYHIQGTIGSSYKYGLTCKNRLVAIMTFNKGRTATGHKAQKDIWELGRYCTVFNFSIVGGAGKLLSHFIKNINPKEIYSYADRRWSGGNLYEKIGFTFVKNTSPNYWYTKSFKTREHRVKYQKHKLTPMKSYNPTLTEEEIMKREKYYKIWDCGSKLYLWKNPHI